MVSAALTVLTGTMVPALAYAVPGRSYPVARKYVASLAMQAPAYSSRHWKLVYKDSFHKQLNTSSAWMVYNVGGSSNTGTEWFSNKQVTVSGGQLHIKGYVDRSVMPDGRIVTGGLGLWYRPMTYGKYEMMVRMQACTDVKYAWMLWPYSNRWPQDGEIDFAEDEGGNRKLTTASLSYAGSSGQRLTAPQDYATPAGGMSAWHVVGVEWTPTSVRYTMDGAHWGATKTTHIPRKPMVLVLQTEGMARPGHVQLPGGSCNADVAWVDQWAYRP